MKYRYEWIVKNKNVSRRTATEQPWLIKQHWRLTMVLVSGGSERRAIGEN